MDMNITMQAIATVGFPIVMCLILAYYIMSNNEKNREELEKLNENHKMEMLELIDAINKNTAAISILCEKMEKGEILRK